MEFTCTCISPTGFAPVFMNDNEISDVIGPTRLHQLTHHIVTTIQPLRVGKHKSQLLHGTNNMKTWKGGGGGYGGYASVCNMKTCEGRGGRETVTGGLRKCCVLPRIFLPLKHIEISPQSIICTSYKSTCTCKCTQYCQKFSYGESFAPQLSMAQF